MNRNASSYLLLIPILLLWQACQESASLEEVTMRDEYGYTLIYTRRKADQAKEGWYRRYDTQNRKVEEAHYQNDTLDGLRILYYESSDTMSVETYRKGLFEGPFRAYHENGQLKTLGRYVNNAIEGEWLSYYPNGQLREVVTFQHGAENGPFKEYYPNGQLKAEGAYLDGDNEHGELKLYNEDGSLQRVMLCNRGVCRTIAAGDGMLNQ